MERQHIALTEAQTQFTGYLKNVPTEIIKQMLKEQEAQWNKPDASVFDKDFEADKEDGGFKWGETKLGDRGWTKVYEGDYSDFYEMYGKPLEPDLPKPKPLYEVGEIIEVRKVDTSNGEFGKWFDAEYLGGKNGQVAVWGFHSIDNYGENNHRKKQPEKTVTLEGKVMTVKEAIEYLTNLQ